MQPPETTPACVTLGGEDEAAAYTRDCGAAWKQAPGAVAWLPQAAAELPLPPRGLEAPHCGVTRM
jgi:hypothetical protein